MDAPRSFRQFLSYVDPKYDRQWFHALIADRCQDLLEGRIRKLMVFVPPQHGKSQIVSRSFPAFALGRDPDLKIVGCSYAATLAQGFSRSIQRLMDSEEYGKIFPDSVLNGSRGQAAQRGVTRTADEFEMVGHRGFYKSAGVCGGLTGTAVDIGIIDDPIKDAIEANSATYRERVWDWYTSVFMTRLHNNSRQLFIMTRWHEDDLAGRILQLENDWEILSIPAIRETLNDGNEEDPRQVGEALWPERHSLQRLLEAQQRSERVFSALYQQHPTPTGGNIVKASWFQHVTSGEFNRLNKEGAPIIFFIDTAYTDKTSNDPTGIIATCRIGQDLYITHAEKVLMKFPDLIRHIPDYVRAHGYGQRSTIRIEPKANGLSVIDQLRETTHLNVTPTPSPKDSKETRLNADSPSVEGGHVYVVDGGWNEGFVDEVCGFPAAPHDEYVDLLCYAIDYHLNSHVKPIDKKRLSRLLY
jgi:predicted phage terminase large subunit-like protein